MAVQPPKHAFRATEGLDAANEKVINVGMADRAVGTDGVNVDFFVEYNTTQQYDPTRGYTKNMAVIYDRRMYYSLVDIAKPAGDFAPEKWQSLRVDPQWVFVKTSNPDYRVKSGEYLQYNSQFSAVTFVLPEEPTTGDTIVIKDVGGVPGHAAGRTSIRVAPGASHHLYIEGVLDTGAAVADYTITTPFATVFMVFQNNIWYLTTMGMAKPARFLSAKADGHQLQAGDTWVRYYSNAATLALLPKYANQGDKITVHSANVGTTQVTTQYTEFRVSDNNQSIIAGNTKSYTPKTFGTTVFTYDTTQGGATWRVAEEDQRFNGRLISGKSTTLNPYDYVIPQSQTESVIDLILPTNVQPGCYITVSTQMLRQPQTVNITVTGDEDIVWNRPAVAEFPRRSEWGIPVMAGTAGALKRLKKITVSGQHNLPVMTFYYVGGLWYLTDYTPTVERVDAKNRARLGVAPLATLDEVNKNAGANPDDESIVTPYALAQKIATETMRGIAFKVNQEDVLKTGSVGLDGDKFITVARLDQRRATVDRAGVAETATDAETADNNNRTHIITPGALNSRRATEVLAGVVPLVLSNPNGAATSRTAAGVSGTVFDFNNHDKVVTPKVLRQYKATVNQTGAVFLATQTEVDNGVSITEGPLVVTAGTLNARKSTESLDGLIAIASQTEANGGTVDNKAITPKKLNARKGHETLTGINRFATQAEFNAGTKEDTGTDITKSGTLNVSPDKVKFFFSHSARTSVDTAAGLTQEGNLWDGIKFGIVLPTETQRGSTRMATQAEVNAGSATNLIVSPARFISTRATESQVGTTIFGTNEQIKNGVDATQAVNITGLLYAFRDAPGHESDETRRGTIRVAKQAEAWVGNNVAGSTAAWGTYSHTLAISPRMLNYALVNYLPAKATAVNSDALGGEAAAKWAHKERNETITGAYTFNVKTTFKNEISVTGVVNAEGSINSLQQVYNSIRVGRPQVAGQPDPAPGSTGISLFATLDGKATTANNWSIFASGSAATNTIGDGKDLWIQTLYTNGAMPTNDAVNAPGFRFGRDGSFTVPGKTHALAGIRLTGTLDIASGTNAQQQAMAWDGSRIRIGNTNVNTVIYGNTENGLQYAYSGSPLYDVLHTKNMESKLNPIYARQDGATFTGQVNMAKGLNYTVSVAGIHGVNAKPSAFPAGDWTVDISSTADAATYPRIEASRLDQFPEERQDYGLLHQWSPGPNRLQQHWTRKGSPIQWVRNAVDTNTWGNWARVYTTEAKPTPEEIGAWKPGEETNFIKVKEYVQIGNLRIRPNQTNRTVEFEWID